MHQHSLTLFGFWSTEIVCDRITVTLQVLDKMIKVEVKGYYWNVSNAASVPSNHTIN